jgi:hypothetical protein
MDAMQMRREAEHGPPRPVPPLSAQQKREIEARHPPLAATTTWTRNKPRLPTGSRTSGPAGSKFADSCSSLRTFVLGTRARVRVYCQLCQLPGIVGRHRDALKSEKWPRTA